MGVKNMWKRGYADKHVKAEQNKQRIRVSHFWVTTSRMLEQVHVRISSAYVCKLDHVYIDPYLETLINTEIKKKPKNLKSSYLSCLKTERKPKTNLNKQM